MAPHQHGAHARPAPSPHTPIRVLHVADRAHMPLHNAEALGLWHEPPRIRRRRPLWPFMATLSVLLGAVTLYAATLPFRHAPEAVVITRSAAR